MGRGISRGSQPERGRTAVPLAPSTLDEFRADPQGRFVSGRGWLHFYRDDTFSGVLFAGPLDSEDVGPLLSLPPAAATQNARAHRSYFDTSRVSSVDPLLFLVVERYVATHRSAIKKTHARLAIVCERSLVGAVAGGFFRLIRPACTTRLFADRASALRWLEAEDSADLLAVLEEKLDEDGLLVKLRDVLLRDPSPSLAEAARALGRSSRQLQRLLQERGSSFTREVNLARVGRAQRLLATGMKVDAVASEVGFASRQHLARLFRAVYGETPTSWRRHRARSSRIE
jgi:AraC-like DNA-binding protein